MTPTIATEVMKDSPASMVARLRDLYVGPKVLPEIVALGESAVPALEALLRGPSESIPHRRCMAADALGAIGGPAATAALARSLADTSARALEPMLLEAEGIVVNRVAEHLGRHAGEPEAAAALLAALGRRPYVCCARALGKLGDARAVPLLIGCLEEDGTRAAAVEALRRFGQAALTPLLHKLAATPISAGTEAPRHVDARVAAVTLLGGLSGDIPGHALVRALRDKQKRVAIAAALALAERDDRGTPQAAAVLVKALGEADWALATALERALARMSATAEAAVFGAIVLEPSDAPGRIRRMRAVEVAARLGSSEAIPVLASLHRASDPNVRLAAIGALARDPRAQAAMLERFLHDPESMVRKRSLESLCRRGYIRVDRLAEFLGDPDGGIRTLAERRLRAYGHAAVPTLRRAVRTRGAPLQGWMPRWRLWSSACLMLLTLGWARKAKHDQPQGRPTA